jgi:hypothetical protein
LFTFRFMTMFTWWFTLFKALRWDTLIKCPRAGLPGYISHIGCWELGVGDWRLHLSCTAITRAILWDLMFLTHITIEITYKE